MFAAFGSHRGRVELEFVGVKRYGIDGLLDLDVDVDLALVGPWLAGLEVEDGDSVVGGFDAVTALAGISSTSDVYTILIRENVTIRSHLDQRAGCLA